MAFSSLDNLVASLPGQIQPYTKASSVSVAGGYMSLWNAAGQPAAGVIAISQTTTGVSPTSATTGAFTYTNNGGGSATTNIARISASSSVTGTVVVYDRLWHGGSFTSANGSISITNPTSTLTRTYGPSANNWQGTELWFEVASALSATATTITITYNDGVGNTGLSATCAVPASAIIGRMFPFVMANGNGIKVITAMSGSAAPTGTFNLVILQRLIEVPIAIAGIAQALDFAGCGFPVIQNNACISFFMVTNTTSTGTLSGVFNMVTN
jgi:hypothetical protein